MRLKTRSMRPGTLTPGRRFPAGWRLGDGLATRLSMLWKRIQQEIFGANEHCQRAIRAYHTWTYDG